MGGHNSAHNRYSKDIWVLKMEGSRDTIQSIWNGGSWYTQGMAWHVKGSLLFRRKGNQSLGEIFGRQLGGTYHMSKMSWTTNTMVSVTSPKWNYAKKPDISWMSEVCYNYSDWKWEVALRDILFKRKVLLEPQSVHNIHQWNIQGSDTIKNIIPSGFMRVISMCCDKREAT